MNLQNIEKLIVLILIIAVLAATGGYLKYGRGNFDTVFISGEDNNKYIEVGIYGRVENPGVYKVREGSRVCDVIYAAGGITADADPEKLDLDAIVTDSTEITVPVLGSKLKPVSIPVVNINEADVEALCLIPSIGESLAGRIVDYRRENGKFSDISDIMNVKGIGEKIYEEIRDYIVTEETKK